MKKIIAVFFAIVMAAGAIAHIVVPAAYAPLVPEYINLTFANWSAAIAEGVVAVALFLPQWRSKGGLLFMALMIGFLPIHILDFLKENPAIGEPPIPLVRILIQFLLIYAGWWISRPKK
ncbi:MAG: hypothetical protein AAGC88_11810 [Bacteroidota bacterium]